MNKIKLLMPILGASTLAMFAAPLASCNCTPNIKVTSVTINDGLTIELIVGAETTLTTKVVPENASDKSLTWLSSDPDKVSVDKTSGAVKALAATETPIITAAANDGSGIKAGCGVIVKSAGVESITLSTTSVDSLVLDGQEAQKKATIYATVEYPTSNDKISWSIDAEGQKYIDIDKTETSSQELVTITAKKIGIATLTASCGGKTATCIVDVGYNQTVVVDGDKIYGSIEGLSSVIGDNITGTNINDPTDTINIERSSFNKKIVLGKTIQVIDDAFLYDCSSFNNGEAQGKTTAPLYIPSSVESIGWLLEDCNAFSQKIIIKENSQLTDFYGFTDIVDYIFISKGSTITLTNGLLYNTITKSALGATAAFNGEIPYGCTHIGEGFGSNVDFNVQLRLPTTLRSIGNEVLCFNSTFAQNIDIPEGVETIGDDFLFCDKSLDGTQTITFPSTLRSIGDNFIYKGIATKTFTRIGTLDFSAIADPDSVTLGTYFLKDLDSLSIKFIFKTGTTDAWKAKIRTDWPDKWSTVEK